MPDPEAHRLAILGSVGVPASYGGFETLAENLVRFHSEVGRSGTIVVYCSAHAYSDRPRNFLSAELRYIPIGANGAQSVAYDIVSLLSAVRLRTNTILLLGVSGAIILPLVRLLSQSRIVTNIDGIEWRRAKWKGGVRWFLWISEYLAVRFSHKVIADNDAIAEYVSRTYGRSCAVIAYGGDHAVQIRSEDISYLKLPERFALALCRIEPENNVQMILEAFAGQKHMPLVFIGNWDKSAHGRDLRRRFGNIPHIRLLDSIYDVGRLYAVRRAAQVYVHGHSAGGTNPSLVEMMHFGVPILAFDCDFNRCTTDERAIFFSDRQQLVSLISSNRRDDWKELGSYLRSIARERYNWATIGNAYFELFSELHSTATSS